MDSSQVAHSTKSVEMRETERLVVIETMNLLEHLYGCEDVTNFGTPTVEEITDSIIAEHGHILASRERS